MFFSDDVVSPDHDPIFLLSYEYTDLNLMTDCRAAHVMRLVVAIVDAVPVMESYVRHCKLVTKSIM